MFNTSYGSATGIRATIRVLAARAQSATKGERMSWRNEAITERVRNAAILIYMVGNALTFTRLLATEVAGLQETGELGGKIMKSLLLSLVWPFYWIEFALFG